MKSLRFAAALTLAAALLAPAAQANDTIRKVIEDKFDMKVEKITRTEHMGLYEVYAGGHMFYNRDGSRRDLRSDAEALYRAARTAAPALRN